MMTWLLGRVGVIPILPHVDPDQGLAAIYPLLGDLLNIALFIAVALSVIFVIIGGFKYTTSAGNPQQVSSAKNTITAAIVGLVIALLALAVVNFASGLFKG